MTGTYPPLPENDGAVTEITHWEPMETLDKWIEELHEAVGESQLCSWPKPMRGNDKAIQAIGLTTVHYGYCFKFSFEDDGIGDKVYHGLPVGSLFKILRGNFRPRVTITMETELMQKFGCVPPLAWFSKIYSCAAGYGTACKAVKGFTVGERLASDIDKPFRMVLEVRVNLDERLAHKKKGNNDQHAYSPESVRRIVALYVIPVSFTDETAWQRKSYEEVDLTKHCNMEYLANKLTEMLGPQKFELFHKQHFDPRAKQTMQPDEMRRLNDLVKKRDTLLQDQKELNDFHQRLLRSDGEWNADNMNTHVQKLSKSARSRLVEAKGEDRTLASLDSISSDLNSDEFARIPLSGRALRAYMGKKLLKKYQSRYKKAKQPNYTQKDNVYEVGVPDPVADHLKEEADRQAAQ